jgi:undecaprenyl-diphosphatase
MQQPDAISASPPPTQTSAHTIWTAIQPIVGRITLSILFAAVGMWIFLALAHQVDRSGVDHAKRFDTEVIAYFGAHSWPPLHALARAVSTVAGPGVQTCLALAGVIGFVVARRFWPDGLTLLVAGGGGALLMVGLKLLFHRPRPTEIFTERLGYSFPSGHSFFAVVLYGLIAYWLSRDAPPRRGRWIIGIATIAILLVGFSRVYLGEHYPTDVAAGYAIAIPWLWGCLALPTAFHRHGRDLSLANPATPVAA